MTQWWRTAFGGGREPSPDQVAAITAPSTGRRSVNAGAGTGKTSTLALRALYLIEAGHVRADEIVVITFTKKAAAEIGSRIADTLDRAIANGASLALGNRGVRCTTIHALASDILREFAFAFGALAPVRAISDGEAHALFHEAFRTLLDGRLAVDTRDLPVVEMNVANLERDLGKLALRLKNQGIPPTDFAARALAQTDRFAQQTWGQLWTAGAKPGSKKNRLPEEPFTPQALAVEAERERANIRVITALFAEFDRRLAERGAATYGDLIGMATRLLREQPDVVRQLRARWRYVLLDESQDTSALQLYFIETLFGSGGEPDAAGMMPVGDTRQAIYGFNGADELVMEQIAKAADAAHPLVVNRRSPQEIVDAGHAVLTSAGVIDASISKLEASAGPSGMTCVRVENFGVAGESIKVRVERESAAIAREVERLLRERSAESSDIAILVRRRTHAAAYVRALNERGISVALDRRSGLFAADEIRDLLAWLSLLVDLGDHQAAVRVLQSPVCGLNDATMIALAQRKDWLASFLRDEHGDGIDSDTAARLARVHALLTDLLPAVALPLPEAMARILATLAIDAGYVRLGSAIGAQAIINLRSFEVLAREFADELPGARVRDFVADINLRIRYEDDPPEAELDLDGVRVLTIHQAKGLEWRFVFVACSTANQYRDADPTDQVIKYDMRSGALALKNDVDGRETFHWNMLACEYDPQTGERAQLPQKKLAAEREQARVFYVAITRAKERVYITAPADSGKVEAPFLASIREWAALKEPGVDLTFDATADAQAEEPSGAREERAAPLMTETELRVGKPAEATFRPRVSFTAIATFAMCPRLARFRYRLLLPNLRDARPRFVGIHPDVVAPSLDAARLGSLAHRALELWGLATIRAQPVAIASAFAIAEREFADASSDERARALASAQRAVEALSAYEVLEVEAPFEIVFDMTHVEGFIDLIARDAAGHIMVIDYKTGQTDDAYYALQLALYRRVARVRYPDRIVESVILRLTPDRASFTFGTPMSDDDLDRAIAGVGLFESDVANTGSWCDACAYRGSPCMAPLEQIG